MSPPTIIPHDLTDKFISFHDVENADKLLLMGTTLATYSAFRYVLYITPMGWQKPHKNFSLLKHAVELKKPVLLLNVGPSRADGLPGVEKIDMASGSIMTEVAKTVMYTLSSVFPAIIVADAF